MTKAFIFILNIFFIYSKIVIPINYKFEKAYNKTNIKSIFTSYQNINLETKIEVGSRKIPINFKLTFDYFSTTLANSSVDVSNIKYNINESLYHSINETKIKLTNEPSNRAYLASDIFYIDENTIKKINFFLSTAIYTENHFKYEGLIGLGVNNKENYAYGELNFINQLKKNKLINDYPLTFFSSNNENYLIIGDYPDIYDSNFYINKQRIDVFTANLYYSECKYYLTINNIISNGEILEQDKNINFDLSSSFIEASYKYQNLVRDLFFDQYMNISKPKCYLGTGNFLESFYYCDKDIDISNMPSLIFQINSYDLNITLTSKDLFELIEDKLIFIVIFKVRSPIFWKIGYLGIKKLNMTFNQDSKTISFYKTLNYKNNNNTGKTKYYYLLIFLISLVSVFIILLIGFSFYIIKNKKNKKRANELDDDFIYDEKEKDKLGIN